MFMLEGASGFVRKYMDHFRVQPMQMPNAQTTAPLQCLKGNGTLATIQSVLNYSERMFLLIQEGKRMIDFQCEVLLLLHITKTS